MSTKANNSPVVKSMRALGEDRGWKAAITIALKDDGTFEAASWGSTVKRCNALALVPPEALARLRTAERRQRTETKARGLPAEAVSVEGLLLLQRNLCGCKCGAPLDFEAAWSAKDTPPGFPVIAHRIARGSRGGHVVGNVFIDRHACNKRDAGPDTSGAASVKRFTPDFSRKDEPELVETRPSRSPRKWQSAGFDRTKTRGFNGKVRDRV